MRLVDWLSEAGMSRSQLARELGISPGRVTQILSYDSPWISRDLAIRIIELTGGDVTPNDFLERADKK